jgi:hypothetical protein
MFCFFVIAYPSHGGYGDGLCHPIHQTRSREYQLREATKSSAKQLKTMNKLVTDAWQEAKNLKKELG